MEAFVADGAKDVTAARWGLRPVTDDQSWGSYMRFASNPNNPVFGQPMVYVEFISVTDVAGRSSRGGEVELAITSALSIGPSEPTGDQPVYGTGYWSAAVDMSEHVEGLPEALDDDDHSSASSVSS